MAVIKSTAYGQARKSVGSNNFYRRAGVQLVRSKPTFAPDRTFTHLQLQQQARMQAVQLFYKNYNLDAIAWASNTSNNKRYNASSRSNRLIGAILKNMNYWNDAIYNDAYEWLLFSLFQVTQTFSVGNVTVPVISSLYIANTSGESFVDIQLTLPLSSLQSMLIQVNKSRRGGSLFTDADLGMCGFAGGNFDAEIYEVLYPVSALSVEYDASSVVFTFRFMGLKYDLRSEEIGGNFTLYFSKDHDSASHRLLSPALFTTSTIIINSLSKPIEV